MNETTTEETEKPSTIAHSGKVERVRYDIEEREGKDGKFYSTRFYRWYKNGDGFEKAYTFATSERGDDLQDLASATAEASNWIRLQLETTTSEAA